MKIDRLVDAITKSNLCRGVVGQCEGCGKKLFENDNFAYTLNDIYLCEKCSQGIELSPLPHTRNGYSNGRAEEDGSTIDTICRRLA